MNKTYLSITITYYNNANLKPEVHYFRHDGVNKVSTFDQLSVAEANKLMWEIIKLGGKNSYRSNIYNNAICYRQVTFWGIL